MAFTTLTGLRIKVPTRGTRNWDAVVLTDTWTPISQHQHTGDPDGLQIPSGGIADNAINGTKIRLANEEYLRARNAADDGDVNILRVNSSDVPEFGVSGSSISLAGNISTDMLMSSNFSISIGNATNKVLITHQQEDRLYGSTSGYVGLRSADTVSTPYTVKFPDTKGAVGEIFKISAISSNVVDLEFAAESTVANQDVVAKSADYTVLDGDDVGTILMTTGASDRIVTLPTAADNANRVITIKKVDPGLGSVIIDGDGSETIDGDATLEMFFQDQGVTVSCDGSNWFITQKYSKDRYQVLTLSADATSNGDLADLTYSALRVGATYSFELNTEMSATSGDTVFVNLFDGTSGGGTLFNRTRLGDGINGGFSKTVVRVMSTATVTGNINSLSPGTTIFGNGTTQETYLVIKEVPFAEASLS